MRCRKGVNGVYLGRVHDFDEMVEQSAILKIALEVVDLQITSGQVAIEPRRESLQPHNATHTTHGVRLLDVVEGGPKW